MKSLDTEFQDPQVAGTSPADNQLPDVRKLIPHLTQPDLVKLVFDLLDDPLINPTVTALINTRLSESTKTYERSLRAQVREATNRLDRDAKIKYGHITSDDYAQIMNPFIEGAQTIRAFTCHEADKMAYDFLLHLAENSLRALYTPKGSGYGERMQFDKAVDSALIDVAKARKAVEGASFIMEIKQSVVKMKAISNHLSKYGINTWFPETISLFTGWVNDEESEENDSTGKEHDADLVEE